MSSKDTEAQTQSLPKKKPFKPHRFREHKIRRPVKGPNYLLWGGLVFALLMQGTIIEEISKWPGFALTFWQLMELAKNRVTDFLLLHAKEQFIFSVAVVSWIGEFLRDTYTFVVDETPVYALVRTMVLSSAVASIGEAVRKNAADQPWVLGLASLAGLGGVLEIFDNFGMGVILLVATMISYARHRDVLVALLPAAAVMVSVGIPQVQVVTFVSYLLLAIYRNWAAPQETERTGRNSNGPPLIFVIFSIAVGVHVTVNWIYARHVVWLAAT